MSNEMKDWLADNGQEQNVEVHMERIIDKRNTGKTHKLLELAAQHNATVVCANPMAMRRKAEAYGIYGLNFITYSAHIHENTKGSVVIDELENFANFSGLIGYTLTNED